MRRLRQSEPASFATRRQGDEHGNKGYLGQEPIRLRRCGRQALLEALSHYGKAHPVRQWMAWANSTTANHVLENGVCVGKTSPWHAAYLDTPGAILERAITPALIPCISIRQPWAWLIVRPDLADPVERMWAYETGQIKDIENRTWPTRKRGPVLIHASKAYSRREHAALAADLEDRTGVRLPPYEAMQRGGIVGKATLIDCVREHPSQWKMPDHWGFVLKDAVRTPFVPWQGQLGWFLVPATAVPPDSVEERENGYCVASTTTA